MAELRMLWADARGLSERRDKRSLARSELGEQGDRIEGSQSYASIKRLFQGRRLCFLVLQAGFHGLASVWYRCRITPSQMAA